MKLKSNGTTDNPWFVPTLSHNCGYAAGITSIEADINFLRPHLSRTSPLDQIGVHLRQPGNCVVCCFVGYPHIAGQLWRSLDKLLGSVVLTDEPQPAFSRIQHGAFYFSFSRLLVVDVINVNQRLPDSGSAAQRLLRLHTFNTLRVADFWSHSSRKLSNC
jgi:hypothetical protein